MSIEVDKKGHFFTKYRSQNPAFDKDTFICAENTVSALLNKGTTSDHPGMLLGKVQSGKTRAFISVLALAFDNGFDVAVVLSKNSKALLEQTYKRLNSEFATFVDEGDVEIYDVMHSPSEFGKWELESKLIFVAKKQSDNLQRLIDRFTNIPLLAAKRTLIIDDEADTASIGYSKKAGLIEANKISTQISELRSCIKHSSFLQVTATPYSLYLQPQDIDVSNVSLFKPTRPAFTVLVPVPQTYVGGETYFGDAAKSENPTVESMIYHPVDHREFDKLKKRDRRSLKIEEVLTSSALEGYRNAVISFIVGGCIQRLNAKNRGLSLKKIRFSFLLHSEATKEAHEWQEEITNEIVSQLAAGSKKRKKVFAQLVSMSYDDIRISMELFSKPVPSLNDVISAVTEAVCDGYITVTKVNSDEDVASLLDSSGQLKLRSPLNIFLGGQVLDRGVTLSNLIGFYYGRRPKKFQQDTVLQHSRMYGYRREDLGVTRFHTSNSIWYAMSQMEEFDVCLRRAIESGGDGAIQFIRKARDGSIVPCSPNKILIASTQTLRPHKRILPIGFQSGYRTGRNGISSLIDEIDSFVESTCGFSTGKSSDKPVLVPLVQALDLLSKIERTLEFPDDNAPEFDWDSARAALSHLAQQPSKLQDKGKVLLWAARNRNSARMASASSHATYIETPDSEKTEGRIARAHANRHPILFMLRQNGDIEKGWRGTPFYWPVIRAQGQTPTAIYTADTIS